MLVWAVLAVRGFAPHPFFLNSRPLGCGLNPWIDRLGLRPWALPVAPRPTPTRPLPVVPRPNPTRALPVAPRPTPGPGPSPWLPARLGFRISFSPIPKNNLLRLPKITNFAQSSSYENWSPSQEFITLVQNQREGSRDKRCASPVSKELSKELSKKKWVFDEKNRQRSRGTLGCFYMFRACDPRRNFLRAVPIQTLSCFLHLVSVAGGLRVSCFVSAFFRQCHDRNEIMENGPE